MIMKNRIISYLLVCIIMFSYIPVSSAQEKNFEIPITVSEKNGISVSGVLQRRGVPFKEGQVFDGKDLVMEENKTAYIIMEYLEGITLGEYLKTSGPIPPNVAIQMLMPIMNSLKTVHKEGK